MQELGRPVLEARKCCENIASLSDCLDPSNFDFVIEAVTDLSGWNADEGTLKCSSIGIKLGHSIEKCALILKCLGIKSESKGMIKQAEDFIALHLLSWHLFWLNLKTIQTRAWNKEME